MAGHAAKRQRTAKGARGYGQPYYNNQRGGGRGEQEEKPNHVLLMTIVNPAYPITVDVIHTISSPSGKVLRIVIFKKNGVQAMVEFDSVDSAKRAKQSLNGADIYSGCCTLKIEYAKPTKLNVYKNDNESWDYTKSGLGGDRHGPPGGSIYDADDSYDSYGGGRMRSQMGYGGDPYGPADIQDRYGGPPHMARYGRDSYDGRSDGPPGPRGPGYGPGPGGPAGMPQQGAVMMVYGLNHEKMNCDKLFNLFCLYGNVVRIKFLKSKEGCAMIQMGDPLSVERGVGNLNNAVFFDSKVQLGYSKQAFLNDVQQPFELPDGTPSFKDYMGNRNNRFTNPEAAGKNRIQPPSRVLHFFNSPPAITEDEMKKIFEDADVNPPVSVKIFQSRSERSSSGLLEFEGVSDAIEGLILCNHIPLPNPNGKFPFTLKLCFSSSASHRF